MYRKSLFLSLVLVSGTCALTCTQKDLCSCKMDDSSGDIDVSTLGNKDGTAMSPESESKRNPLRVWRMDVTKNLIASPPMCVQHAHATFSWPRDICKSLADPFKFKDMIAADGLQYSLNLCYPFNEMSCTNTAACQISTDGSTSYAVGDATNVGFETDTLDQVHIKYTHIDGDGVTRTTDVRMICSPSADPPLVTANGETSPGSFLYEFLLYSKCGCAGQCGGGGGPDPRPKERGSTEAFSVGTIIIIVALSLGFSYMVGGILYMKMVRHARGTEVVPNVSFWGSLPGLVKDGFVFTLSTCMRCQYNKI